MSHRRLLVCITLVSGLVGCGVTRASVDGGDTDATVTDGGAHDTGSVDLGAHDAGSVDLGTHDAATTDAGAGDAGPPVDAGPLPDYAASERAEAVANCMCDAMPGVTLTACVNALIGPPVFDDCLRAAYAADAAHYAALLPCMIAATDAHTACLAAPGGCAVDARSSCNAIFTSMITSCVGDPYTPAFMSARDACVMAMIVGTGADTCSATATASTATGDAVFSGTTIGAGDHRTGSCSLPTSGADVALRWTAPATATYTMDTIGSEFDTVLYVRSDCSAAATELACNDDGYLFTLLSQFTVMVSAGETVNIIVDGADIHSAGVYQVNIH